MTFCKFSPGYESKNKTLVDNAFISDFLPDAPDLCIKAYLLGLMKCGTDENNNINYFSATLKVCEDDVVSLFRYWEDKGLVQILSTEPIEVRYLPINARVGSVKKFEVDKYLSFNIQAQEIMDKRLILPNDFAEFYYLIEKQHIQENALLEIMRYCVENKGFALSPKYVITVAKDWISEGVLTVEQVEEKIRELGLVDDKMMLILSALGTKRKIQLEDKELLNKWLNIFGFELNVVLSVAKYMKNKKRKADVYSLDTLLTKYFEMRLMSFNEIENYENEKENLFQIAIDINKELGVYYEDLTNEIDTYIVPWVNMGFEKDMLKMVADNCFKSSIRTLDGLNSILNKLFKLGIVNIDAYLQYLSDNLAVDEKIKQILLALNLSRNVNNIDRNFFNIWTADWLFEMDVILYAASLARDKANAIHYLNKVLSSWNSQGVKTLDKAQVQKVETSENKDFIHNEYTKEQIKSLISNLDEVEV